MQEEIIFWAVATPECSAFEPPTAGALAGGRYRRSCSAGLLAPSLANL